MTDLPPELQQLAVHLNTQPAHAQRIFQYYLCLMMVEAGKMKLVETIPGESGAVCVFETVAGDTFSVTRSPLDEEQETDLIERLRSLLKEK